MSPIQDEDDVVTKPDHRYSREVFDTLRMAFSPYLLRIFLMLGLGALGRMCLLANTNLIGFWVDSICGSGPHCRPPPEFFQGWAAKDFLLALMISGVLGFLLTTLFRVSFSRMSAEAVSTIYDEVTLRTSRYPIRFFDQNPVGRVVTRFSSDYGNVFRLFGGPLAEFIAIIMDLIVMVILIAVASPYYLILVGIIMVLNYLVYRMNRKGLRAVRRELSVLRSPSIAHFAETTQGASSIRAFGRQSPFKKRFERLDRTYLNARLRAITKSLIFSTEMNFQSALLLLMVGLSALWLIDHQKTSVGSLAAAFGFTVLSANTVLMFFEWLSQIEDALVGAERLDRYLRKPLEVGGFLPAHRIFKTDHPVAPENQVAGKESDSLNCEVRFENVWFRYAPELPWVLKDVSLNIAAGEKVGIVGRTGSGKSSLIQSLFHLYPIEKGRILVNGKQAIKNIDLEDFRRSISYISQEPILFQGSLRDNLDQQKRWDDETLKQFLKKVGQSHLSLDLRVEERGKNLSLGERQLICLARILAQNRPLVIFDEATSSVDPQSEELMVLATDEFFDDRTQIIIAHRLSTLKKCDRVVWFDDGQIKKIGKADEIIREIQHLSIEKFL